MNKMIVKDESQKSGVVADDLPLESTTCNLCGADDFAAYLEQMDCRYPQTPRHVFRMVKCNKCGLIYLNPRPTEQCMQRFYPDSFYEPRKLEKAAKKGWLDAVGRALRRRTISKALALHEKTSIVERSHSEPGRILDIGSCAGEFLYAMKKKGWDVMGVEVSGAMCEYVLETYDIKCINRGATGLTADDLEADYFDVITLWATLAHIDDPKRVLQLCHSALKPGGKIVILTSNADSIEEKWFAKVDRNPIDIPRHLYHFNITSIRKYFETVGFDVKMVKHFTLNAADRLASILCRLIRRIPGKSLPARVIRYPLIRISRLIGCVFSAILSVLKRSHTIIVVGEKAEIAR